MASAQAGLAPALPRRALSASGGFSLVEVLFACALLALALVPLMRAAGRNRAAAEALRGLAEKTIADNDASAREAAEASVTNAVARKRDPAANAGATSGAAR